MDDGAILELDGDRLVAELLKEAYELHVSDLSVCYTRRPTTPRISTHALFSGGGMCVPVRTSVSHPGEVFQSDARDGNKRART